jgi:excisionase family DNA binding protein
MTPQDDAADPRELVSEGLLDVRDAATFLGLSVAKLYGLMESGELAYAKIGRSRRIPRKALIELAARHLVAR